MYIYILYINSYIKYYIQYILYIYYNYSIIYLIQYIKPYKGLYILTLVKYCDFFINNIVLYKEKK